ncbi:MerR family transcriptional regulator [Planomicrobium sp. Y74]|uniref:MerR family transcriptional regulator n=1 Tax=Planomicrobium sp. Y74 TaxID=2478977 RepID=UPI000EF4F74C|nr:MerR family transcriptional regulator [Planomicrobium sp. Y74]RLQ84867.1 MerR family transcriptional regulator [Planomicrobium sp. Y74]
MVTGKEAADKLQIAPSTLRNYAKIFEDAGHGFQKDDRGYRIYTHKDIELITALIELRENSPKESTRILVDKLVDERYVSTEDERRYGRPDFPFPYFDIRFKQFKEEKKSLQQQLEKQEELTRQTLQEMQELKSAFQDLNELLLQKEERTGLNFWSKLKTK